MRASGMSGVSTNRVGNGPAACQPVVPAPQHQQQAGAEISGHIGGDRAEMTTWIEPQELMHVGCDWPGFPRQKQGAARDGGMDDAKCGADAGDQKKTRRPNELAVD